MINQYRISLKAHTLAILPYELSAEDEKFEGGCRADDEPRRLLFDEAAAMQRARGGEWANDEEDKGNEQVRRYVYYRLITERTLHRPRSVDSQ